VRAAVDPFAGVTEEVRERVAGVLETEWALLELRLSWPELEERQDCPTCAGGRFGFPAELDERRIGTCAEHAEHAQRVITERLERAPASNRDGWAHRRGCQGWRRARRARSGAG
jgi:hypothetical protein